MSIFSKFRKHSVISIIILLAVIIIAVIAGRAATEKAPTDNSQSSKQVTLINAATFRQGSLYVGANGVIESHSQADLRSQSSAPISSISVAIGDSVSTGQEILELQNADIRAQLSQAEASLALAQGQFSNGAVSLDSAKQAAIDKIRDAYTKTYAAIANDADTILYNDDGNGGRLTSYSVDTALNSEITAADFDLRTGLRDWKDASDALTHSTSTDEIKKVIAMAKKNMSTADLLLNDMSKELNNLATFATPSFMMSVNAWKSVVSGAQSSISGVEQALTGAETALNASISSQGSTANAAIAVAQAGVDNLEAQLSKTVVRSPIYGKVSDLPLREGELATPGTLLATVVGNDSGLVVKAYVSGEDLSKIKIGSPVVIQSKTAQSASSTVGVVRGIVSNIAPSVDATTKKAEVDIDVVDPANSGLVIGNNVSVSIAVNTATASSSIYLLPIQDVKIVPGATYLYTVDPDSKIVRNDVTLGQIQGDFVQIVGGLRDDMDIVTPVYELDIGQKVKVQ